MIQEEWLIDGFNLLHFANTQYLKNRKISREQLFHLLASFAQSRHHSVLMILDGKGFDSELEVFNSQHFKALYSQGVSADSAIEKYLFERKNLSQFVVVTQDRAIANIAHGSGARVMRPKEFLDLFFDLKKDNEDILFKHKMNARQFNRPFEGKI